MLKITTKEGTLTYQVPKTESDVWKKVGETLLDIAIPNQIDIDLDGETARLTVGKRGTYVKDGVRKPSMYVKEEYNFIYLPPSNYDDAYLTCVNPESNNYKFYWLRPHGSELQATYGRIGSERGEAFGTKDLQTPYDSYLYWIRYYEKLSKGYVDMTDIYLASPKASKKEEETEDTKEYKVSDVSKSLYDMLRNYAHHVVEEALVNSDVTEAQVMKTRELLTELGQKDRVDDFNAVLSKILQISPRRARYINQMYAYRPADFSRIVLREENLLAAMEAVVPKTIKTTDCFEAHDIRIFKATEKQEEEVRRHLADGLDQKVVAIYRVIDKRQKARFDTYLKKNGIKKVKQFWHGSRNENWLSIMLNGLQLNPNARITGKMFGQGIYFAPRAQKSFGYTSCEGSYWAHGSSNTGFMGLYATAYGNPLMVNSAGHYDQSYIEKRGANCVHATPANTGLRNEEVIYYDESAMVLNYIVQFAA